MNTPEFLYEAPEDNGAGLETTTEETEAPAYSGPSQEEWQQAQQAIKQLTGIVPTVQQMAQYFAQANQPEYDEEELDIDAYIEHQVESRIAPLRPILNTAAQKSGEERMKSIFSDLESGANGAEKLGKFDHKLAERAAHSFFAETGDPQGAVIAGAKYAAEVRRQEREEGVNEYKASLKRGPQSLDPDVVGGGDRQIPPAKTYDEVIERYAGQTEV